LELYPMSALHPELIGGAVDSVTNGLRTPTTDLRRREIQAKRALG
jgi:hypothetical protein